MPHRPAIDPPPPRIVIGIMTGTSIDGIDVAIARIHHRGLSIVAELLRHHLEPMSENLRLHLRAAAEQDLLTAREFAQLAHDFAHAHVTAIHTALGNGSNQDSRNPAASWRLDSEQGFHSPQLICLHGQTIYHSPPLSWQLINPAPIAAAFKCPVIYDLRAADLAAGGQGAPMTPIADWILFRHPTRRRAVINLGGFCNVTILPRENEFEDPLEHIRGFDVCVCNQLLDAIARELLHVPYDNHGEAAGAGTVHEPAMRELLVILQAQRDGKHSLGTGDEAFDWINVHRHAISPSDLAATATCAIGTCIGQVIASHMPDEILLAGGGANHSPLSDAIHRAATVREPMHASPAACVSGVEGEDRLCRSDPVSRDLKAVLLSREPLAMAILGALSADGIPLTLPHVTGCSRPAPIAGAWCNLHRSQVV